MADHTSGRGADVVIESAGRPESMQIAGELTRRGGRIVLLGIVSGESRVHTFETVLEEKQFIGSNGYIHDEDFAAAVAMAGDGRLNLAPMVTSRIKLVDIVDGGLEALRNDKHHQVKILVSPRD